MPTSAKQWFKSKGIWLGILTTVISVLTLLGVWVEAGEYTLVAIIGLVIGVLQIVVRVLTNQPLGK